MIKELGLLDYLQNELPQKTTGFSGADLEELFINAAQIGGYERAEYIGLDHIEAALIEIKHDLKNKQELLTSPHSLPIKKKKRKKKQKKHSGNQMPFLSSLESDCDGTSELQIPPSFIQSPASSSFSFEEEQAYWHRYLTDQIEN